MLKEQPMTSQINPNNIDGNYPVAGQPNNTQGMRDNFTNTKTNLQYAADEISDLQGKVLLKSALTGTTLDNNMNGGVISDVKLQDVSYTELRQNATAGTVVLDYSAANYQAFPSITGNLSLGFTNWPVSGSVGTLSVAFVVTNTAYTLTLPAAVSIGIATIDGLSPGTPGISNTITFAAAGVYVYVFESADGGANISIQATVRPSNTYSNIIDITNTTPSTTYQNGALVVAGGAGFGSNLNVAGNFATYNGNDTPVFSTNTQGFVTIRAANIPANTNGALNIVGSANAAYQPVYNIGSMLHITGVDETSARTTIDTFSNTNNAPLILKRRARGTAAAPTAVQTGDVLSRIVTSGWGTTGYALAAGNIAATNIEVIALENFTNTAGGTKMEFYTAAVGAVTKTLSASISATQTTLPAALSVVGNIVGGNVTTTGLVSMTGNVTAGNISTAGTVSVTGNVVVGGTFGLSLVDGGTMGYNTGAGGTVAQAGNKTQGVTLNKPSGEITMQNTNLAAATSVSFTLTNSTIGARDLLLINLVGGGTPGAYFYGANCTTGSAVITVRNLTAGTLGEALVLRYAVIKGSIA